MASAEEVEKLGVGAGLPGVGLAIVANILSMATRASWRTLSRLAK